MREAVWTMDGQETIKIRMMVLAAATFALLVMGITVIAPNFGGSVALV